MRTYRSETALGRAKNSLCGIPLGLLLFVGSFFLLGWNEKYAVQTWEGLADARETIIAIDASSVSPENDRSLVYLTSQIRSLSRLADHDFGLNIKGLSLQRSVEMYQNVENTRTRSWTDNAGTKHTETVYTYTQEWKSDSNVGYHMHDRYYDNPTPAVRSRAFDGPALRVGAFEVSKEIANTLTPHERVDLSDPNVLNLPKPDGNMNQNSMQRSSNALASRARIVDNALVIGDGFRPAVGDLRITYKVLRPSTVSVIGKQTPHGLIVPFETKSGYPVGLIEEGSVDAETMLDHAHDDAVIRTWILRGVGWLLMCIGIAMVLDILTVAPQMIPFIGGAISSLVGCGVFMVALLVSLTLSLTTIAISWFLFRPVLSVALLASAAIPAYLAPKIVRASKKHE